MNRNEKIRKILSTLRVKSMTRQEVSAETGIPLESVCGRVAELMDRKRVEVVGHRFCQHTGKNREVLRAVEDGRGFVVKADPEIADMFAVGA